MILFNIDFDDKIIFKNYLPKLENTHAHIIWCLSSIRLQLFLQIHYFVFL